MKIENHRLVLSNGTPVRFVPSPNQGGELEAKHLVMHYTAGSSAQESIDWLCSPNSQASAHLVIARDGSITQLVPFDLVAWHAGKSAWNGITGLNRHSIGIELDNPGPVQRVNGRWRAWFKREYPDGDVITAKHKLQGGVCGWVTYTEAQIETAVEVARTLVGHYALQEVLGHEEISPTRKTDPGPAFPMASFRAQVLGGNAAPSRLFVTTAQLNIRKGPGTEFDPLGDPLGPATMVEVLAEQGSWRKVDVEDDINKGEDRQGWVHFKFLRPA